MGIKKAKTKEVRKIAAAELGIDSGGSIRLERIYMPQKSRNSQIFDGPAKDAAAKLIEKLRFEARVL
jgi:electron transfer flavoprotein beta subunit